jgi:signal transduction histidine kinase
VSETQATERAERLNTILDTMADAVVVLDQDGRIIQTNRAYRELLAVDHMPGFETYPPVDRARLLPMRDIITGEPLPIERNPLMRALRSGEVVTGSDADFRVQALDGRDLEANTSAAPLRDDAGRVAGAVCVIRDMTWFKCLEREREAARAQAVAARADELTARDVTRHIEAFLATAAHDLRAPLTTTVGYLTLAERCFQRLASATRAECPRLIPQVDDMWARLDNADKSVARLSRLLTLLFDTAAIRADRFELHRATCDLAVLVHEQVEAALVAAPSRVIRLREPVADRTILVEADADRIAQTVTNYLTNALKYGPPDRPVDVSVEARGNRALVKVSDAGPGLPREERVRVWDPFHRVPGVTAQRGIPGAAIGASLGLGLYICKTIVEAHGGRVGVKSVVGEGSTFWFIVPLAHLMPR